MGEVYYNDSQCTIYCGDALTILVGLPSESVQMVFTSPP